MSVKVRIKKRGKAPQSGGESEIRTRERLAPSTVFKTVAINRSAISPIIFQHTLRNSVPTTVCGSTAAPDAPCSPISASLRCQDRCNQPLCHLSNNFSTYPSELRSDDGLRLNRGAYAPCSPISASLRCQDRCNQPLSFKTTGAVLVCTQNSPKGQEFFKNYLRLPIRRR